MVILLNFKKANFIFAFFFSLISFSQEKKQIFYPEFEGFKKIGFFIAPVMYQKASIDRKFGEYEIINKNILSFSFGFEYVKNHTKEWTFRSGLRFDLVPFYNIEFVIPNFDLDGFGGMNLEDDNLRNVSKINITIPLLYEVKKQMGENVFFSAYSGFNMMLMQPGRFELGYHYAPDSNPNEGIQVFGLYGEATNPTIIYPNFVISPGFYFVFNKSIMQLNIMYQKALVKHFKGEYQFGNLEVSPPSRGDYILSGNYLGMSLTMFLKKKKVKNNKFDY
ncbi:MAG: hypothetical protein COZ75_13035 [Flavobacteriaceae bacterium CG_4_8_14_3_um_filter_34_10]|nr:MAG: hypothetical protein COZ75_13035 [Flavobacteriaceae bacterium CG_4_8_14_3_um_filter_34_10]